MTGQRFTGRRIVVTGAGSGIGLASAKRLAAEGAEVIGLDIRLPAHAVPGIDFRQVDVTDAAAVDAVFTDITRDGSGRAGVDGLAAFAGVECTGTLDVLDDAAWRRVIDVNLFGTINVSRAALHRLRRARGGRSSFAPRNCRCRAVAIASPMRRQKVPSTPLPAAWRWTVLHPGFV